MTNFRVFLCKKLQPDGYPPMAFFTHCWEVINKDVIAAVQNSSSHHGLLYTGLLHCCVGPTLSFQPLSSFHLRFCTPFFSFSSSSHLFLQSQISNSFSSFLPFLLFLFSCSFTSSFSCYFTSFFPETSPAE